MKENLNLLYEYNINDLRNIEIIILEKDDDNDNNDITYHQHSNHIVSMMFKRNRIVLKRYNSGKIIIWVRNKIKIYKIRDHLNDVHFLLFYSPYLKQNNFNTIYINQDTIDKLKMIYRDKIIKDLI